MAFYFNMFYVYLFCLMDNFVSHLNILKYHFGIWMKINAVIQSGKVNCGCGVWMDEPSVEMDPAQVPASQYRSTNMKTKIRSALGVVSAQQTSLSSLIQN